MTQSAAAEAIRDVSLADEARRRYLTYAMSVITARALPDVRDGLKPVQRRILYTMHRDLGLRAGNRPRKCAKIVGEVMGSYHPHGDGAIYESLVRMAQDFTMRHPLVEGIGNFGSVDGDEAAAYRYTEARLAPLAEALLAELDEDTVPTRANFDNTRDEAAVLPARYPNLLVNGTTGIAVGLSTNIPPHNLRETIAAAVALLDDPNAETKDLVRHVRGPDFPLGGKILATKAELLKLYEDGSGSVRVQGTWKLEDTKEGRRIIVTSIPHLVNKGQLEASIGDLVSKGKLPQVTNVINESNDREGIRIVLDLRPAADPEPVMAYLFRHTTLAQSVSCNFTCLVPNPADPEGTPEPKRLGLKAMLQYFLDFRREVVRRRITHELRLLEKRLHILAGFEKAFSDLPRAIEIIRKSQGREDAAERVMKAFGVDEAQADAIVRMPLYRIAAFELKELFKELKEGRAKAASLRKLLADEKEIRKLIKTELEEISTKYGDKRRTTIESGEGVDLNYDPTAFIAREDVHVLLTQDGWIKRIGRQASLAATRMREGDQVVVATPSSTVELALFFADDGNVYSSRVNDLPGGQGYGEPASKLFKLADRARFVYAIALDLRFVPAGADIVALTTKGRVVRMPLDKLAGAPGRTGRKFAKLDDDERIVQVLLATGKERLIVVTGQGVILQVTLASIPRLEKVGKSTQLVTLQGDDALMGGALVLKDDGSLSGVTSAGVTHVLTAGKVPLGKPGDKGAPLGPRTRLARLVPQPVTLIDWNKERTPS